ncbi:MAG: PepSY domain-containing protein [Bacteroidetes bacterium]|nr:PepSY domain-containing protein [Bacteroidota bacterium]
MLRKNIYKWHRTSSLIIAIPIFLWASSGFMHPIMTNIRPEISTQSLKQVAIDSSKIKISLSDALKQNQIDSFSSVRFIHIDTNWFYQVQDAQNHELVYLSSINGKLLKKGDWLYAQYLARFFLMGDSSKMNKHHQTDEQTGPTRDCCDAATVCVMKQTGGNKVSDVSLVTAFDEVYQTVNRLLPVYKVSFERKDGMQIYVETLHDRFVFAADIKRIWFSRFFSLVHTWGWLDFLGKGRLLVEMFFTALAFLTTLMGIYIFFITKSKKSNGNGLMKARRNHRLSAIFISLFTLMFTFSGCYHAFSKLGKDTSNDYFVRDHFISGQTDLDLGKLKSVTHTPISNISLVKMDDGLYWQVSVLSNHAGGTKDLMKSMSVAPSKMLYVKVDDNTVLEDGEKKYANYLATRFSRYPKDEIKSTVLVTKFDEDYNFADKLLPVWKVSYGTHHHERYYVETSSGKLSKRINDREGYERNSFAFLHKHEFLNGFGKPVKDFSTMFWAMAQLVLVVIGLRLYLKYRKRKLS